MSSAAVSSSRMDSQALPMREKLSLWTAMMVIIARAKAK